MPFGKTGGRLGVEAAQKNAATLRGAGVEPSVSLRFQAAEISHDQLLQLTVQNPNFAPESPAGRRVLAELDAAGLSRPSLSTTPTQTIQRPTGRPSQVVVLFEAVIEGVVIKLIAERG